MPTVLHVFCGPFPTVQGTQTLVRQTCELGYRSGFQTTLLCYAHGSGNSQFPFEVARIRDFPPYRSERSGPAWQKPFLDLSIARTLRRLIKKSRPDILHAHHYEALVACRLAAPGHRIPLVFHQHARFGPELHTYAPPEYKASLQALGLMADGLLPNTADHTIAVSHANARHLERTLGADRVSTLLPPVMDVPNSRHVPRTGRGPLTMAYMGNLDAYQGLDHLVDALKALPDKERAQFTLRLITDSDPAPFQMGAGVVNHMLEILPHGRFADAWNRLIECDMAVIPRSGDGGIPVKLVNCLAAGMPTIVDHKLADGINDGTEALLVNTADADALSGRILDMKKATTRRRLSTGATGAAERLFSSRAYQNQLEAIYRNLL